MNNRMNSALILTFFVLCSVDCCQAGSIWAKRDKNARDLYADDVARHIGDILTIKISEVTHIDSLAERDLEKTTKRNQSFDGDVGFGKHTGLLPSIKFGIGTEHKNELDGSAEYKDDRTFTDLITVTVVDIMPNGNLVVMGTRKRDIIGDTQVIEVSGIVRTSDIAFDNTVESERVADFRVVTKSIGISTPYNEPNWLGRLMDIIWPF